MYFNGDYISSRRFRPGCYFETDDIDEIIEGSLKILDEVGIKISDDELRNKLAAKGFTLKGDRVFIEKEIAREYLEYWRKHPKKNSSKRLNIENSTPRFNCTINEYCTNLLYGNSLKAFTMDSLVTMTKLVEKLSKVYGFSPNVAGNPGDVPYDLQSLARFFIAAKYCHQGYPDEPETIIAAEYMFKMAEVVDYRITKLPVYVSTPLTLGGDSLEIAVNFKNRVQTIKVTSMPSFGANTPHSIPAAFSLVLAEVLGSAVVINDLTGVFCDLLVQMHPFDFRTLNFVYGSPEHLIFEWLGGEFNAMLAENEYYLRRTNIHTHAKTPGFQSAAEKASLAMAGALHGATVFNGVGALSLDEIFSPVQLVLDLEILCHVWRVIKGVKKEKLPTNLIDLISEGLGNSYINTDLTLDNISEFIWYPQIFERTSLASSKSGESELTKANELVEKYLAMEDTFILDKEKTEELNRIWDRALLDSRVRY